jgi:hypothetical protein
MCMSCATSADALVGGAIVRAAGLRVAVRTGFASFIPSAARRSRQPAEERIPVDVD